MTIHFRNTGKKIIIASLAVVLSCTGLTPAHAEGPDGGAPFIDTGGCMQTGGVPADQQYVHAGNFALKGTGKFNFREDIGYIRLFARRVIKDNGDETRRYCALTKHGSKTWNKSRYTVVKIGTEDRGGGNRRMPYFDKGSYERRSNSRAITPGEDRCVVVIAKIKHRGKVFNRVLSQKDIGQHNTCN